MYKQRSGAKQKGDDQNETQLFLLGSLTQATGREFTEDERKEFLRVQRQAIRWTYLGSGMTHPNFLETLEDLRPAAKAKVQEISGAFS